RAGVADEGAERERAGVREVALDLAGAAVSCFGDDLAAVAQRCGRGRDERDIVAAAVAVGQRDRSGIREARGGGQRRVLAAGALNRERLFGGDAAGQRTRPAY